MLRGVPTLSLSLSLSLLSLSLSLSSLSGWVGACSKDLKNWTRLAVEQSGIKYHPYFSEPVHTRHGIVVASSYLSTYLPLALWLSKDGGLSWNQLNFKPKTVGTTLPSVAYIEMNDTLLVSWQGKKKKKKEEVWFIKTLPYKKYQLNLMCNIYIYIYMYYIFMSGGYPTTVSIRDISNVSSPAKVDLSDGFRFLASCPTTGLVAAMVSGPFCNL